MIQYPKMTDKNVRDINKLKGMIDVMPTILDLCKIEKPTNIDGETLVPLLTGTEEWDDNRNLIIQCPRARTREKWKNTSIKQNKWRLVDGKELYNIENNFGQLNDVAIEYPAEV
jgi:arylsulfatase A-like enzyme